MKQFAYHLYQPRLDVEWKEVMEELNKLGAEGWELISWARGPFLFKREVR